MIRVGHQLAETSQARLLYPLPKPEYYIVCFMDIFIVCFNLHIHFGSSSKSCWLKKIWNAHGVDNCGIAETGRVRSGSRGKQKCRHLAVNGAIAASCVRQHIGSRTMKEHCQDHLRDHHHHLLGHKEHRQLLGHRQDLLDHHQTIY